MWAEKDVEKALKLFQRVLGKQKNALAAKRIGDAYYDGYFGEECCSYCLK